MNEIELAPLGKPYDQSGRFPLPAVSGIDQVRIFFAPLRTRNFPHQFAFILRIMVFFKKWLKVNYFFGKIKNPWTVSMHNYGSYLLKWFN